MGAHCYLSSAAILRNSDTWDTTPKLRQRPALQLLAHGIELLLKYPLLQSGLTERQVGKKFGHDSRALWSHEANADLRNVIMEDALHAWEIASRSGQWPADDFAKDPAEALAGALEKLAWLHIADSGYALRYLIPRETIAPRPAFLIEVFSGIAERIMMNSRYLEAVMLSTELSSDRS
jgi:hypothetical protein